MQRLIWPTWLLLAVACARPAGTTAGSTPRTFGISVDSPLPGAGKLDYSCPADGIDIFPEDDAAAIVDAAPPSATLCFHGEHRVTSTLIAKSGQTWIGVDTDARISGAQPLTDWQSAGPGIWVYSGPWAKQTNQPNQCTQISPGVDACYQVSTYEDDVFYNDQRMMRVLSLDQLTGAEPLPPGQAQTDAEVGHFFFDYDNHQIYIDQDPSDASIDLAVLDVLVAASAAIATCSGSPGGARAGNVTLENLLIEKALFTAVDAHGARSWTLQDCTVRFAHVSGISGGGGTEAQRTVYNRVLITNNGRYGIASGGSWITIQDSELSWNNIANYRRIAATGGGTPCDVSPGGHPGGYWGAGATKFVLSQGSSTDPGLWISGLNSHHNVGDGFWTDIHNQYVAVANSHFHDNERSGYFHEISCEIEISGSEFDHNGLPLKNNDIVGGGISVNDSNNGFFHDNLFHDNGGYGVQLIFQPSHTGMLLPSPIQCVSPPPSSDGDTSQVMMNNLIQNNSIYMCSGYTGSNGAVLSDRNNQFAENTYFVPSAIGSWWRDPFFETWDQWQADGQDPDGSLIESCSYP
jgi:hypothetical protein